MALLTANVELPLRMRPQPDDRSCGPTCLHAVYTYFGRDVPLDELINDIVQLETGGTLAVQLGCDALRRGFDATIHTYNLQLFDPTWFLTPGLDLRERLTEQARCKVDDGRLERATAKYVEFLNRGGRVEHRSLEPSLIEDTLAEGVPLLTGLSATYLYDTMREVAETDRPDDVHGEAVGHFVVLCGFDRTAGTVTVADPWPDPDVPNQLHCRSQHRVLAAILLGVLTYDANLLVIRPR